MRQRWVALLAATSAIVIGVSGCGGGPPLEDPALGRVPPESARALQPDANLLASARHVMAAYRAGVEIVFVDARPELDYNSGHIPGAVNVPYFDVEAHLTDLPKDKLIVAYCECPHAEAVQVADKLLASGFAHVKVIDEGLAGWRDQGGELVTPTPSGG